MKKSLLGILVGAVVYFVWLAVSWMVLPWHNPTIKRLPEEQLITDTIKTVVTEPGFYAFPHHNAADGTALDPAAFEEKVKKGPSGLLVFSPGGRELMPPSVFVISFVSDLFIAAFTMLVLCLARDRVKGMVPRAFLIMGLGVAAAVATHGAYWNWFHFPTDVTRVAFLEMAIGFLLLGFAQAKFVPKD